jgi:GTP cyclohydrolase II
VKRQLIALLGAIAVLLAIGSGAAQAQVQAVEQAAGTGQSANSSASSTQTNPSNSNISVRIFSPGDSGSVSQSNNSVAGSIAGNAAKTDQAVSQSQGSGGGEQAVGQVAETIQQAKSKAESKQEKPSNSNISVRIHSPGDDGDVSQSNNSVAGSAAGNLAETSQGVAQQQGGGEEAKSKCCGGSGVQAVGQEAKTIQKAESDAKSVQEHASNENIPVRIGSKGDNGSVEQSNNSVALSLAGNAAKTTQGVEQTQGGGCGCHGDLVQAVGQKAITGQLAESEATSIQKGASNSNTPVRIHSEGDDGDVEQSNNSIALSAALNAALTDQAVGQSQGGGCGCGDRHKSDAGERVQAVGQWAETWQAADSDAKSEQWKPSNSNTPVREKSKGGGGSVSQSNNSLAASLALNLAATLQRVRQEQ